MPQTKTSNQRLYALMGVFSVVFLIGGPQLIGYGVYCNHRDSPSLKWPTTTGKIVNYDKTYHGGRDPGYNYTATYSYSVNGRHYTAQRYALWSDYVEGGGWSDFMETHPISSSINVYYDPQDPASAVLSPGPNHWVNRNGIVIGTLFMVSAIGLLFRMRTIPHDWEPDRSP